MEIQGIKIVVNTSRTLPEGRLSDYPGIFNIQHLCAGPVPGRASYLVCVGLLHIFNAAAMLEKIADDYESSQVVVQSDSSEFVDDFAEVGALLAQEHAY